MSGICTFCKRSPEFHKVNRRSIKESLWQQPSLQKLNLLLNFNS
uniref:Uncharacterized protein n=1 Tax=Rhizophora mucronata TaxID=61149 RepID=A0A2P2MYB9_RHIMU